MRVTRRAGRDSTLSEEIRLSPGSKQVVLDFDIDWHERQRLLKLAFPLDIKADASTSEMQFGHVERPTHQNTSWDAARYEICAHRWIHVGEAGYGIAVLNDSTYGHDVTRGVDEQGHPSTTVRLPKVLVRSWVRTTASEAGAPGAGPPACGRGAGEEVRTG